jgi:hypothetical protein
VSTTEEMETAEAAESGDGSRKYTTITLHDGRTYDVREWITTAVRRLNGKSDEGEDGSSGSKFAVLSTLDGNRVALNPEMVVDAYEQK